MEIFEERLLAVELNSQRDMASMKVSMDMLIQALHGRQQHDK